MSITTHLLFAGNCEQAFRFYASLLGGELKTFPYSASPIAESVPAGWRDKLLHATLTIGGQTIMGADVQPDQFQQPQGFYMAYVPTTKADAERVFTALADGGTERVPLQETFWSPAFGVVTDRFGISWEINCEGAAATT